MGIALVITHSPLLFMAMKALGAGYLIYLGWKSLTSKSVLQLGTASGPHPSAGKAFAMGFLTNALNPKTMLFVAVTYSQVVQVSNSLATNFAYGLFMSLSHWVWFSLVALFFSTEVLRQRILARQNIVDKVIGAMLIGLGVSVVLPGLTFSWAA